MYQSIHMIRADIETAVSPIVGNEKQSEDMVNYLLQEFEGDTSKIWQSNIFGRSFHEVVSGEDPVVGALRELKEETGAEPETFLPLGRIIPAPGCYGEILHLFLAKGLKFSEQHLDPDEFLNVERVPFDEMVHRCMNGEIDDAKTVAAVLRAKVLLNL